MAESPRVVEGAMHPTIFELRAFGRPRLPAAKGRAILRHLRGGCASCRAALAPRLIPWMDEGPAAEALATDPLRSGRTLNAAYLSAATRAVRAAAKSRLATESKGSAGQALAILDAEGPEAIGRLPRRLLGLPAVEALLQQTTSLGHGRPKLRLRLAELACDLAMSARGEHHQLRQARCRAFIELANSYRVNLDVRAAQRELDRAAEILASGDCEPLLKARMLEIKATLYTDMACSTSAGAVMAAAACIYRQQERAVELARALLGSGRVLHDRLRDYESAYQCDKQALELLDPGDQPPLTATTLVCICSSLHAAGRWPEALEILRQHHPYLLTNQPGVNGARLARIEGDLLAQAGDMPGAARAFTSSRWQLESIGRPYERGLVTLTWANLLQNSGEASSARTLVADATETMLKLDPHPEVYMALMVLRTANRFSATRSTLPLKRMIDFIYDAQFNPSLRLQSYLA